MILDVGAAYRDGARRFGRTREYGGITVTDEMLRASATPGLDTWLPAKGSGPFFGLDRTASRHFTAMDLGYPDGKVVDFVEHVAPNGDVFHVQQHASSFNPSDRLPGEDGQAYLRRQMKAMSEWELQQDRDLPRVREPAEYLHAWELEEASRLAEAESRRPYLPKELERMLPRRSAGFQSEAEYLQSAELEHEITVSRFNEGVKALYDEQGVTMLSYAKSPLLEILRGKG